MRRPGSDFYGLLEELAQAYAEAGPRDMDVIARRRELHDARTPGLVRACITPASISADSTLGRIATLKWSPSADDKRNNIVQESTAAQWAGAKAEAQAVTVDCGLVSPPPLTRTADTPAAGARPYGIITYGSDGCRVSAKFDLNFGVRFTIACDNLTLLVGMDRPATGAESVALTVGASVGFFSAPSLAPVVCSLYVDSLDDGDDSGFLPRPLRAVQLLPILTDATGGDTHVEFYGFGGAALYSVTYPSGIMDASPVILGNDVAFVRVVNDTGAPAGYSLPFQLAL